jgi:hypothetical protein
VFCSILVLPWTEWHLAGIGAIAPSDYLGALWSYGDGRCLMARLQALTGH